MLIILSGPAQLATLLEQYISKQAALGIDFHPPVRLCHVMDLAWLGAS